MKLIGISGTLGAGKDTAAHHLMQQGFMHVSTGDVLRAEATKRGLSHERPTLIELGVELRRAHGSVGALVIIAVSQWRAMQATYPAGVVVSGLRIPGEAQEVHTLHGTLLFIDAPVATRYQRIHSRARGAEATKTLQEFTDHDQIEYQGLGGPEWPNLRAIKEMADRVLVNDGSEAELIAALDATFRFDILT